MWCLPARVLTQMESEVAQSEKYGDLGSVAVTTNSSSQEEVVANLCGRCSMVAPQTRAHGSVVGRHAAGAQCALVLAKGVIWRIWDGSSSLTAFTLLRFSGVATKRARLNPCACPPRTTAQLAHRRQPAASGTIAGHLQSPGTSRQALQLDRTPAPAAN